MKNKSSKNKIVVPPNHSLVSRREFLAHGLIAGTGVVLAPTFLGMIANRVYGQIEPTGCEFPSASNSKVPVIVIDLAGGGSIAGSNVLVGKSAGQTAFLEDYTALGRPSTRHPAITGVDSSMGIAFHPDSGILNGILTTTNAEIRSKVDGAIACAISNDDTATNPHNPLMWLSKYGLSGNLVSIAGTTTRASGGNSTIPADSYSAKLRAVRIANPNEAINLGSLGQLANDLDPDRARAILRTANSMSVGQLDKFNSLDLPAQVKEIAACGYINSNEMPIRFNETVLNPSLDSTLVGAGGVYAESTATFTNNEIRKEATIAKMVLDRFSGSAVIEKSGYDYHGDPRQSQHRKDFEAGQAIGRFLSAAARKGSSLLIYVMTDGGLTSDGIVDNVQNFDVNGAVTGELYQANRFVNDAGQAASAFMLFYNHRATRDSQAIVKNGNRQVGWFRSVSGRVGVDPASSVLADNVTNLSKWVVLNYLALHGEEGRLSEIVGDNPFSGDLAKYLVFNRVA